MRKRNASISNKQGRKGFADDQTEEGSSFDVISIKPQVAEGLIYG